MEKAQNPMCPIVVRVQPQRLQRKIERCLSCVLKGFGAEHLEAKKVQPGQHGVSTREARVQGDHLAKQGFGLVPTTVDKERLGTT